MLPIYFRPICSAKIEDIFHATPRFIEIFAGERDRLQQERIAAYREYIDDISNKKYPEDGHSVSIDDAHFDAFLNSIS
jgi:3-methyl-2-oxobutanoate hydroxymethyltransferase